MSTAGAECPGSIARSDLLGVAFAAVAKLAVGPAPAPDRDDDPLASRGLPSLLALEATQPGRLSSSRRRTGPSFIACPATIPISQILTVYYSKEVDTGGTIKMKELEGDLGAAHAAARQELMEAGLDPEELAETRARRKAGRFC
jgi:hypothetical protein